MSEELVYDIRCSFALVYNIQVGVPCAALLHHVLAQSLSSLAFAATAASINNFT